MIRSWMIEDIERLRIAQLREKRVPLTAAAIYVARALGEHPSTAVRGRLAALFRQRTLRDRRHADQREVPPQADSARLPSDVASTKEEAMPKEKLIKRVTTVETYESGDVDPEIDADEDEDVEDESDDEDDEPSRVPMGLTAVARSR